MRFFRSETNIGLYQNWNKLIGLASGEFIAIYHDHDIYLPTIVEESIHLFEKYPSIQFVHTAHLYFDAEKRFVKLSVDKFPEFMRGSDMQRLSAQRWDSAVLAPTTMVRRSAYEKVGLYMPEKYGLWCDLDMWFRLCSIGDVGYARIPQVLYRTRVKGQFTSILNWKNETSRWEMKAQQMKAVYGPPSVSSLWEWIRFIVRRDRYLLQAVIRAGVLDESDHLIREGIQVLRHNALLPTQALGIIGTQVPVVRRILRKFGLPLYYRQKWETGAQESAEYAKQYPHLMDYLTRYA
jgi:hypothetical protein